MADQLSFEEVKRYLQSYSHGPSSSFGGDVHNRQRAAEDGTGGLGALTLAELKSQLSRGEAETEELVALEAHKRQAARADELRELKIKHQKLKSKRNQDLAAIKDLVTELEKRKEEELRIRLERQRLMRNLKKYDKKRLSTLETEKKKELEALAKEKKLLQQREHELLEQVNEIEGKICAQEKKSQEETAPEASKALLSRQAQQEASKYDKLLNLAKEHGRKVSALASEKQKLLAERQSIENRLFKSPKKAGVGSNAATTLTHDQNINNTAAGEELERLLTEVESKLPDKKARLERLVQEQKEEEAKREADRIAQKLELDALRPPGINKAVPFAVEAREFLDEWLTNDKKKAKDSSGARQAQTNANTKALEEASAQLDTYIEEEEVRAEQEVKPKRKPRRHVPAERPSPRERSSPERGMPRLIKSPRPSRPKSGRSTFTRKVHEDDGDAQVRSQQHAELLDQMRRLERSVGEANSISHSVASSPPPQGLTPRHDTYVANFGNSELNSLEESIKNERREMMQQRAQFSQTLNQIVNKLSIVNQPVQPTYFAPPPHAATQAYGPPVPSLQPRADQGIPGRSLADSMASLDSIPQDSALYKMRLRHMEKIVKLKCEAEALVEEQKLSEIRESIRLQKLAQENKTKHEMWKAEQQRKLAEARMKKLLAMENQHLSTEATQASYNPHEGFLVFFDYLVDVPKQFKHLRIAYAFYHGPKPKTKPKALPPSETDKDAPTTCKAVFATHKHFKKISPLQELNLVVEVQSLEEFETGRGSSRVQSIGWTILQLFDGSNQLKEGLIKLPLLPPPMHIQQHTAIMERPQNQHMTLFLRNVNACNAHHAKGFVVDSSVTQHLYKYPFTTQPADSNSHSRQPQKQMPQKKPKRSKAQGVSKVDTQSDEPEKPDETCEKAPAGKDTDEEQATDAQQTPPKDKVAEAVPEAVESSPTLALSLGIKIKSLKLPCVAAGSLVGIKTFLLRDDNEVPYANVCTEAAALPLSDVRVWETEHLALEEGSVLDLNAVGPEAFAAGFEFTTGSVLVFELVQQVETGDVAQENVSTPKLVGRCGVALSDYTSRDGSLQVEFPKEGMDLSVFQPSNDVAFERAAFAGEKYSSLETVPGASLSIGLRGGPFSEAMVEEEEPLSDDLGEEVLEDKASEISSIQEEADLDTTAWIETKHQVPEVGEKGVTLYNREEDGFDVYVDGARFLPDNITLSSVQVKCMMPDYNPVGETVIGFPRFDDSAFNPKYKLRAEMHGDLFANPTTTLLIRVDGVDRYSKETIVVGYCALPAFLLSDGSGKQPEKSTEQDYHLNSGGFQVALHQRLPERTAPLSAKFLDEIPRVPCATLLVRVHPAQKSEDGLKILSINDVEEEARASCSLIIPAPSYESGAYDSVRYSLPLRCERMLYRYRNERDDPLIEEVTTLAKRSNVEDDKNVDVMEDQELMEWIKHRLSTPSDFMGIKHAVKYHPEAGFKLMLAGLHDLRSDGILKVVYSLAPPASFYTTPKLTEEVDFSLHADWDAKLHSQTFVDETHNYRDVPFDRNLVVVFDVKSVTFQKKKRTGEEFVVKDVCWTFLPVFDEASQTVRSGCYQLPLFEGPPPKELLDEISTKGYTNMFPDDYSNRKKDRLKLLKPGSSLIVSLVDTLVADCVAIDPVNDDGLNKIYLPKKDVRKYETQTNRTAGKGKAVSKLLPKTKTPAAFEKELNEAFGKQMEITHYTL